MTFSLRLVAFGLAALSAFSTIPSHVFAPVRPHPSADALATPLLTHRQAAHTLALAGHVRLPYSSNDAPDTWDGVTAADADPSRAGNVLSIYGNASYRGGSCGEGGTCVAVVSDWNREHLWAKSYGINDDVVCNLAFTDLHHLRASEPAMNTSRSNDYFDWCRRRDCSPKPLLDGSGRTNRTWGDIWEVWDGRRGDVARALMYMDVRYEGGRYGTGRCVEPDLRLTDDRSLIVTKPYPSDVAYMGVLSTLVEWHLEDPPDELERRRNDVIDGAQGNRNPFIDQPELACAVFTVAACARTRQVLWLPAVQNRGAGRSFLVPIPALCCRRPAFNSPYPVPKSPTAAANRALNPMTSTEVE